MHMVLPATADGAALEPGAGPCAIATRMLGSEIELIATFQRTPQCGLRIQQTIGACADIQLRIATAAARAQLQQSGTVVIALQH